LVSVQLLSKDILDVIETRLDRAIRDRLDLAPIDALAGHVGAFARAGGKRVRPQLVVWTWLNALPERIHPVPEVVDVAVAWEMFHAFVLVHDDIIDASEHRRGLPTLHHSLASLDSNCLTFGSNLAIVAGDLLFATAFDVLHAVDIDPRTHRDLLRTFSRIALQTGFGQAIDIIASHRSFDQVNAELILREYLWKTAAYTFEGPMLSGAILAGVDRAGLDAISRFALSLGQAYQLQNDLIDLAASVSEGSDLVQGKRTVSLIRHRTSLDAAGRASFDRRLQAISVADGGATELAESLRRDLLNAGVHTQTQVVIDDYRRAARQALADEALPASLRDAMESLAGALDTSYFRPVEV
jgi:geranylgeranyl diphosphate synthase type I